jgi:formylglycine-generating enzyme required for sulfatase activity
VQQLKARTIQQMVFVEGGTFMMGDVGYIDGNGDKQYFAPSPKVFPVHQVTLTSYSMNSLETTFGDYDVFTNYVGKDLIENESRHMSHKKPEYPAKGMNWYQAREYCQWLGEQIAYPMDLPTEAQWEYAARSRGLAVAYATNNGKFERGINIRDSKQNDFQMPVGSWPPNPLGMYDMTGNVNEWTVDNAHSYTEEAKIDPIFDEYIAKRPKVTRGFGIIGASGGIKLYKRIMDSPDNTGAGNGIRCVVNHPEPLPKKLEG